MNIEETKKWLMIMRANLKEFPEISNGRKIVALTDAIYIVEAFEAFFDPNVSDKECYKMFEKVRKRNDKNRI